MQNAEILYNRVIFLMLIELGEIAFTFMWQPFVTTDFERQINRRTHHRPPNDPHIFARCEIFYILAKQESARTRRMRTCHACIEFSTVKSSQTRQFSSLQIYAYTSNRLLCVWKNSERSERYFRMENKLKGKWELSDLLSVEKMFFCKILRENGIFAYLSHTFCDLYHIDVL